MWRRVILVVVSFLLTALYFAKLVDLSTLSFLIPFIFLFVFYLFIIGKHISVLTVVGFTIISIIYAAYEVRDLTYLLFILALATAAWSVFIYMQHWNQKVIETEEKKRIIKKEVEALRERYQARMESLKHLERRVVGLVHLFEIARDFNECLDFSEILSVLNQKIAPEFSFVRGAIILLELAGQSGVHVSQCLPFGPKKGENETLLNRFAGECLNVLMPADFSKETSEEQTINSKTIGTDEESRFAPYQTAFPLWLFPLTAEHRLIAMLTVEGAETNDFQRFEVLASQLALQVKKVQLYETVRRTSIVDGLTNVFVRRHFLERFQEELKRAFRFQFPLSVLMVDVDHFKSYNDKFGHPVGDKTLREVAHMIRENVRRVDVIGRYGGEEFIIAAPEIEKKQGLELAERIRSAIARKHFRLYDEETQVTVSIGVSSFPEDFRDKPLKEFSEAYLPALVQKADQALYRAKEEGRNRVVVYR